MIKSILKKFISPRQRRALRSLLSRSVVDEADIVYRLLSGKEINRVMIDVGAHHGGSLTKFAESGWRVHAFEPDGKNREVLSTFCQEFDSVRIDARAVSNKNQKDISLYTSDISTGISTLSAFHESHQAAEAVDTITLQAYIADEQLDGVDFLKIDTEGHDFFVLQGVPWDALKPEVILCEFEDRKTKPLGYTYHDLAGYLRGKGYHLLISEWFPVVEYGKVHRWRRFAEYPVDLLEEKAWGNMIAVQEEHVYQRLLSLTLGKRSF